jgi:hypothetical protein
MPRSDGHRKSTWDRELTSAGEQLGGAVVVALLVRHDAE